MYSRDQDVSMPKPGSRRRDDEPSRETSSNTDPLRPTPTEDHDVAHKSKLSKVAQAQVAQQKLAAQASVLTVPNTKVDRLGLQVQKNEGSCGLRESSTPTLTTQEPERRRRREDRRDDAISDDRLFKKKPKGSEDAQLGGNSMGQSTNLQRSHGVCDLHWLEPDDATSHSVPIPKTLRNQPIINSEGGSRSRTADRYERNRRSFAMSALASALACLLVISVVLLPNGSAHHYYGVV